MNNGWIDRKWTMDGWIMENGWMGELWTINGWVDAQWKMD